MITGYNTDIPYEGKTYHLQTEDKGLSNPMIESLIYVGGEILAAQRTSYAHLVHRGSADEAAIAELLEQQHKKLIREIRDGRHDPDGLKPIGEGLITDRSLDQVVLDYIGELLEAEHLELMPIADFGIEADGQCNLQLLARGNLTGRPIKHTEVVFQLEGSASDPEILFQEKTGSDGIVRARFTLPGDKREAGTLVAVLASDSGPIRWERSLRDTAGPDPS
jgi:hypothetical protein